MLASVGVCVLVLAYTLLGAFAFMALEGSGFSSRQPAPPDPVTRASAPAHDELRTKTVEKLWSITEDLNILYKDNWTRLAAQEVLRFQDMLVQNIKSGVAVNGGGAVAAADGKDPAKQVTKSVTTAASTYQHHGSHRWTFPSSFLYSLTLITTIGYGSVSPRTTCGRLVSISYAIVGIPLMLLYLSTTGESLARSFRQAYSRMCHRRGACPEKMRKLKQGPGKGKAKGKAKQSSKSKAKAKQAAAVISSGKAPAATSSMKAHQAGHLGLALGATDELTLKADRAMIVVDCGAGDGVGLSGGSGTVADTPPPPPPPLASVRVPVLLCLLVLLLYVAGGAFLFHYLEGWSLVEGSYFCFTTLGTIGFGDLIPGRSAAALRRGFRGEVLSVLAASAYILVGMALVAMTFALVQDEFVGLMRRLGRQCSSGNVQPARPKTRPSCSDSESNTDPPGGSLSAGESLPMAVVSSSSS
ncbi:potassium channel subfamily K member 18-like [Thrips palmi]|uniref:Potassium channel subfamily K member 18-like n=1 Tax=Thrips palmi TaxID=161013 RepID=A0A6P8YIT2_THRPL|nr:potassium channel subfamily K member 18-like [Thrips palmi]